MGSTRPRLSSVKGGAVLFPLLALLSAACAGPSGSMRKQVNAKIASGDYAGAEATVASAKELSYGSKNAVLYYLDLGAIQHDAGKAKDSDRSLDAAENRMDQLFTKSLHKAAGTFLLNDNTTEYAGERFERALVNVYRACDYLLLGDRENALVEIRKLSRLLQEYSDLYGRSSTAYKDDAFGQYLSSLLYEDGGQNDDARISREAAERAYRQYASAYGTPVPALTGAEDDGRTGELVFIHANGVAPRKESRTFQVAWNEAVAAVHQTRNDEAQSGQAINALRAGVFGRAITVAYPVYVQDPYRIVGSAVDCDGATATSALVEDVSAIAEKDLSERQGLIRTRAVARAAIKYILAKAATDAMKKKYGDNSLAAIGTQIFSNVAAAATEVADTRGWATLPAQFRLARLRLPPGQHQVTVRYLGPGGASLLVRNFTVTIVKGRRTYLQDRTAL